MNNIGKMTVGLLMALTFVGCSSDDDEQSGQEVTLTIPIEIYSANPEVQSSDAKTRVSQGDPGNDVVFKEPLYLYIYACVYENGTTSTHELLTDTIGPVPSGKDDSKTKWTLKEEDTQDEHWEKNVAVTFKIQKEFDATQGVSRVYAIASRVHLGVGGKKVLPTNYNRDTDKSTVEAMTLDLSAFTSDELKDIYSTPLGDTNNGVITSTTNNNVTTLTCSAVRLYHVAAKVDFTWEVASKIQSTTELASITCTGLPTTCKVFEPTNNPTGTGSCIVLGTSSSSSTSTTPSPSDPVNEVNAGNKWLGRAYAFMLQPPTGEISYTVTYNGSAKKTDTKTSITPTTLNDKFTGWYRVIATVE